MTGSTSEATHPARVTESFGRRVIVETAAGARCQAELFGKRLNCVCGDEVMIRDPSQSSGDVTKVVSVLPRRSLFARTDSRGRMEPLAANLTRLIVLIAPNPEPDLYIAGMKSYGRAPTFLAMTGYEQVRSIAAELAGDHEAARRVELTLPDTGVCNGAGLFDTPEAEDASGGCCGAATTPPPRDIHEESATQQR